MPDNVNSYFGNIGNTFYAGPNGASFSISKTYNNYRSLVSGSQTANILVGEYVAIDYGMPGSSEYDDNKDIDYSFYSNYYNGTLYQKTDSSTFTRIFQNIPYGPNITFSSSTPLAPGTSSFDDFISKNTSSDSFNQSFTVSPINAWDISVGTSLSVTPQDGPSVSIDTIGSNPSTTKYIHFGIPPAWNMAVGSVNAVDPGGFPSVSVSINDSGPNPDTTKYIHFDIPSAWDMAIGASISGVTASSTPSVTIDNTFDASSSNSLTTKYVHFGIPPAWNITAGKGSTLSPGADPEVSISTIDNFTKKIILSLPTTTQISAPILTLLDPELSTSDYGIATAYSPNNKQVQFTFKLPRGARVFAGAVLNNFNGGTYNGTNTTIREMLVGDIYISTNGNIWKVIQVIKDSNDQWQSCVFASQGTITPSTPIINLNPVSPSYNTSGVPTASLTAGFSNGWSQLNLDTYNAPIITLGNVGLVGPTYSGSVSASINANGLNFTAQIPRGARILSGLSGNMPTSGIDDGDYYIATDLSRIYRFTNQNGATQTVINSFQGEPFEIINNIAIRDTDLTNYSGATTIDKIKAYLNDENNDITRPEIQRQAILLTYIEGEDQNQVSTAYWFYTDENNNYQSFQLSTSSQGSIISPINPVTYVDNQINNGDYLTFNANNLLALRDDLNQKINNRAPIDHASTSNTYGLGSNVNYGHLKLSNDYTDNSLDTSSGTAATPKAVYDSLIWGTWSFEDNVYVLSKNGQVIPSVIS